MRALVGSVFFRPNPRAVRHWEVAGLPEDPERVTLWIEAITGLTPTARARTGFSSQRTWANAASGWRSSAARRCRPPVISRPRPLRARPGLPRLGRAPALGLGRGRL
jgi:hypothetical protein